MAREITMLMQTGTRFYPITCVCPDSKTDEEAAAAHGVLNPGVLRVEAIEGKILWERPKQ